MDFDSKVRGKGLQPEDNTDIDEVTVKVNQSAKEYTVGPFNISYTSGDYGSISFGGISDMKVIGYDANKRKVKEIEIIEFAGMGSPRYFTPGSDKVDRGQQNYPEPDEDFEIVFKDPGGDVAYISIEIEFKYMLADGTYTKYKGSYLTVVFSHSDTNRRRHRHHDDDEDGNCTSGCYSDYIWNCEKIGYVTETGTQPLMYAVAERTIYDEELKMDYLIDITMDLGGQVWEDILGTKETIADGVSNTDINGDGIVDDIPLKNVKVTLYTSDGKVAKLLSNPSESGINSEKIMHRVNPTYTDERGDYLFEGLDPMKKYYVTFEYNGQTYLPTEYLKAKENEETGEIEQYSSVSEMVADGKYNTTNKTVGSNETPWWEITSKGTEKVDDRNNYDNKFEEIRSYPENYITSNSLGVGVIQGNKAYNRTFTQKDLMGYTLGEDGKYKQTGTQLVDGYLYDEKGLETTTFSEGVISQKVREFISKNRKYPSTSEMKNIYSSIAGNNSETWQMLQFIEDCKIVSYTQSQEDSEVKKSVDLYPVYDKFVINHDDNKEYDTAEEAQNGNYPLGSKRVDGVTYRPIYPGQLFINQGLWRRQESDLSLRKDVYRATLQINDKTIIYKYDKRTQQAEGDGINTGDGTDNDTYWDINVRMSDYGAYYNSGYNRELYLTDYAYDSTALQHPGTDLDIYVTYKITVRNQSMSIMNQIQEVVDYYDKDYTYVDKLSWVTYVGGDKNNTVLDEEYYDAMVEGNALEKISNARETKYATSSRYGSSTHSDIAGSTYQAVYIKGLEDKRLATGESAYIYLTFQVNKDAQGRVILDENYNGNTETPKENIAEINGYKTYYKEGTKLPNGVKVSDGKIVHTVIDSSTKVEKENIIREKSATGDSGNIAGSLDRDSNPGNLIKQDLQGEKYEKNFEDDTDRAASLRVIIDKEAIREANGTVWEDERTVNSDNSIIGDGIREQDENTIEGVTVQLVEKTVNGKEYIWQETTTNADGYYEFERFIPGDYVIRFYYGNTTDTVLTDAGNSEVNKTLNTSGNNETSYNGQDFKSTTYQTGIEQSEYTNEKPSVDSEEYVQYAGYRDTDDDSEQNISGSYGYDIYASNYSNVNVSDAKDLWDTDYIIIKDGNELKKVKVADWLANNNRIIPNQNTDNISGYIGPKITTVTETDYIQGRSGVISYSDNNVTNHKAEVLASPYEVPNYNGKSYSKDEMKNLVDELIANTYMTAETGVIAVELEYDRQQSDGLKNTGNHTGNSSSNYDTADSNLNGTYTDNWQNGVYHLSNIDLGLTERPKAQLETDKSIENIKVTLANGSILFDVKKAADNVIWKDHEEYNLASNKKNSKYEEYYDNNDSGKHRYSFRETVDNIVSKNDYGLIQLTMDEELMHGSTIEITYKLKVTNVGEIDYRGTEFYYTGKVTGNKEGKITITRANQVVDYVANNLQFDSNNTVNNGWSVIKADDLTSKDLVNTKLSDNLAQYNTIIQTEGLNKELKPGETTEKTLILSQLITTENTSDDLTYNNMIEIVKTSNTVGRRMAYSVVGNQNPTDSKPSEVDSSVAERVIILPPFGEVHIYYILGAVIALMLIGGIILIKKKVLTK